MRKIRCLFIGILFMFVTFIGVVNASTYAGKLYEVYHPNSGFTVFAEEKYRNMDYNSWMIKSTVDNRTYYCIDPTIPLEGSFEGSHKYIIGENNIKKEINITSEQYKKINLLAFYGYKYNDQKYNHSDKKWYGITQVMIWRVMRPDLTWTFKESRDAKPDKNLYKNEIKELNYLVSKHDILPSFVDQKTKDKDIRLLLNDEITLKDTNDTLYKYYLSSSLFEKIKLTKNDSSVTIKGIKQGREQVNFSTSSYTGDLFAFLTSSNYQDVVIAGYDGLPHFSLFVDVVGGTLNIRKLDKETNASQGDATLKGAKYEIYDKDNKFVKLVETDEDGKVQTILDYGDYIIKEKNPPQGYKLDPNTYNISISKENNEIDLDLKDEVIKGRIIIKKTKGGSKEKYIPEENAVFEIYDINNKLVDTITTDKEGLAYLTLPYGKYKVKQIKGADGYVISDDYEINIEQEKDYQLNIKNKKLSIIEITKLDEETNRPINDTFFEIYKDGEKVFEGKTDDDGKIKIENVKIGTYTLKEVKPNRYYRDNDEEKQFTISENGTYLDLKIKNTRKRGNVTFYKIDSLSGKKLENASIRLEDNILKKTVFKGKTDKDGKIYIKDLVAGSYCFYEEKAPFGYKKDEKPKCFELIKDNENINISMVNEKLISVPNTFKDDSKVYVLIGIFVVIVSLSYLIYVKQNK